MSQNTGTALAVNGDDPTHPTSFSSGLYCGTRSRAVMHLVAQPPILHSAPPRPSY
jgi:hypothetical protein